MSHRNGIWSFETLLSQRLSPSETGAEGELPARTWRRHANNRLAFTSRRRATTETEAPGAKVSATILCFSSADHIRRRRRSTPLGTCCSRSDTNIADRVHHRLVDTIIVSARYPDCPIINTARPGGLRRMLTVKLQRKIEAYRQVQHDSTSWLYSGAILRKTPG